MPALVVSGFLGAGKTTLVRNLLEAARRQGLRVALVSNELGALGIDRALLGAGGEAYVELEGGCVCCELSDDLVDTLERLHAQVDPDRIIVETSGAALPFDTQLNFWREPVARWLGDDMAVVVVDAEQLAEGRDLEGTFEDQVVSADLIVLNKLDLVPEDAWPRLEAALRALEPDAPIVHSVRGDVEPDLLFVPDAGAVDRSGPGPAPRPHRHEPFATEEWRAPAGVSRVELERALRAPGLVRAKGFVETAEGVALVQLVGRRLEVQPQPAPDPRLVGRVVLIRRGEAPRPGRQARGMAPRSPRQLGLDVGLEGDGFDVAGVLAADAYDAEVPPAWRSGRVLPGAASAVVLGCSGRAFAAAFEPSPEAGDGGPDPVDRFTARCVGAAAARLGGAGQAARALFYWERRGGEFADFVALGRACGLGSPGRLGVLLHPELGPWLALRAVLLTGLRLAPTPPLRDFDPCRGCPAPCAAACPVAAPGPGGFDAAACARETRARPACRVGCAARRACVLGPQHAYPAGLEQRFRAPAVRALEARAIPEG